MTGVSIRGEALRALVGVLAPATARARARARERERERYIYIYIHIHTHTVRTAKITDRTFIISATSQVINYCL